MPSQFADFTTGAAVNFSSPAMPNVFGALGAFYVIVKPYESLLVSSYSQFPAPSAVPPDLLLPFGQFVTNFMSMTEPFVPVSGRNIEVYKAIATCLSSDVLYGSTVAQSLRTIFGVVLWVKGSNN
ncbi:hypothetical protein B0H67DRAFT_650288 [Lasiosphaeris hirsuta]|uniref:Uncharacterized protein n=1 Tax=Lasiosphaeris hirsuta TaxID=260670 RepID=A0AA40DIQ9_9PEZI|nr:hypothetical protein B0H67DRAFT_650288 [Lasiosphaeris hirsuta]